MSVGGDSSVAGGVPAQPALRSLVKTCDACPSQWEGETEDGRAVYVRYRWGYLSVGMGSDLTAAVDASFSEDERFGKQIGNEYDGFMDEETMLRLTGLKKR